MKVELQADYFSFYNFLYNLTSSMHQYTYYSYAPAFGESKEGDYIVEIVKAKPDRLEIPVRIKRKGKFDEECIDIVDIEIKDGGLTFDVKYPEDIFDLVVQILENALRHFKQIPKTPTVLERLDELQPKQSLNTKTPPNLSEARKKRMDFFVSLHEQYPAMTQEELALKCNEVAFDEIKDQIKETHPEWSEQDIEGKAQTEFTIIYRKAEFTKDDLRYDFRELGIKWKRKISKLC